MWINLMKYPKVEEFTKGACIGFMSLATALPIAYMLSNLPLKPPLQHEDAFVISPSQTIHSQEPRLAESEVVTFPQENVTQKQFYQKPLVLSQPSPNYTVGRSQGIDRIVLHTTEGSGKGALSWLTNPTSKASAHYLILEDGTIYNLVSPQDTAWHCRGYNEESIGIEYAGSYQKNLNESQINAGTSLLHYLMQIYGLDKKDIFPHSQLDPTRRKDPGKENLELILNNL